MDHLLEAKGLAAQARAESATVNDEDWPHFHTQLAIAHALIAIRERMDKTANDAEAAAEREDLIRERMAQRQASERIL